MNPKKLLKSKRAFYFLCIFGSVLIATILSFLGPIEDVQLAAVNELFSLRGPVFPPDTSIVIVGVDDQSFTSLPSKWPFPTFYYARAVRNLQRAGARLIIFDIEFTEPNHTHPEYDLDFARAVNDVRDVVLAGKIVYDMGSYGTENIYALRPIAPLLRSEATWGFVNVLKDPDGFIRRYLLFQKTGNKSYYPLAIEALRLLQNVDLDREQDPFDPYFQVGEVSIPKATPNSMYINYRGPAETFRTYSIVSIIDDEKFDLPGDEDMDIFEAHLEWGTFRDKIVFIGATAEELQDFQLTPFYKFEGRGRELPGVEMHANALSTLLRGDFITDLNFTLQIIFTLLLAALASFITLSVRPVKALVGVALESIIIVAVAYLLFTYSRQLMVITRPVLSLLLAYLTSLVYQTVIEQREKYRIRQTFRQYVAPAVVDKMLSTGELPAFGGERRELTVLFSDIRRFTSFCESKGPDIVVSRLSEYLTEMVDVIFKFNGTLDKFVGDEIMALFGAPYYYGDHAHRACMTALEMVEKLRDIQKRWSEDRKEFFHIGIGINTGNVIVGNLGSSQLFDYTVIGDEVNLGARLEGANKEYQTTIILSESTYHLVRDKVKVRELDVVRVVGKSKPIRIFELRGMDSIPQIEQDYIVEVFTEGLNAYRERQWSDALKSFRRVLRYFPSDGPSRIYTIRCLNYIEKPPPPDWDGVYAFTKK